MNAIAEAFVNIRPDTSGFRRSLRDALDREIERSSQIKPIRIPVLGVAVGDATTAGLTQLVGLVGQLGAAAVAVTSQVGSATGGFLAMGAAAGRAASLISVLPTALASVGLVAGTVKLATLGVGDALEAVATGAEDAAEQISKLPPPAQAFAKEVQKIIPRVERLQLRLAAGLFPGVTEGFKAILPLFPDVERAMERTSIVIGDLVASVGRLVGGPLSNELRIVIRNAADIIEVLTSNVTGLVTAFVTTSAAAAPLARLISVDLSESVQDLTDRFIALARTDEFTDFLEDSYRNLTIITQIAANVGVGLGQAFLAALGPGEQLLRLLRGLTFEFRQFASSDEGKQRMREFFERGAASATLLASVVGNVLASIANIGKAAGPAGTALVTSLDNATAAFRRFTGSADGQNKMTEFFNGIVPVTQEFGRLVVDISAALLKFAALPGNEELLRQIRTELLPALIRLFTVISETNVLNSFITFLTKATELLTKFSENSQTLNAVLDIFNGALDALSSLLELPGMGNLLTFTTYVVGASAALRVLGGLALGVGANVGLLISAFSNLKTVASTLGPILRTAIVGGLLRLAPLVGPALAAVFSPPVLIAAAVVAAGVLIFTFRDEIGRFFTETLPDFFTEKVPELFSKLRTLFDEHAPTVLKFFEELPGNIAEAIGKVDGFLIAKGIELLAGFDSGILEVWQGKDGKGGLKAWFGSLGQRVIDATGDLSQTLLQKGKELVGGLFKGVGLEWDEKKSFWENLGVNIAAFIKNPDQFLRKVGRELIKGLFNAAKDELIFAGNLAIDVEEALRKAFRGAATWLVQIGKDVILGFFKGLDSYNEAVFNTAKDIAGKFITGFKDGLKSSSPSKKMMVEGVNAMAGFMLGIDSQRSALEKQVADVAAAVVDGLSNLDPKFKSSVSAFSLGAERSSSNSGQVPTVVKHYNLTVQSNYESEVSPEENFRRMELLEPLGV